ncbi:hypothetical protein ACFVTC_08815 [Streptomyces sp. NPDC057950]|uniref:hypothetical protein n=1 Tax=Streptomyces sp. NPDC057950 TaxID=3346288 RepID=UPI0036E69FA3
MKILIVALTVTFLCTAYAWPVIALLIYPMNRRRGFWAALYCCVVGVFFGTGPQYSHFNTGEFFGAAIFTSAARAAAEAAGILERPRSAWRRRHTAPVE